MGLAYMILTLKAFLCSINFDKTKLQLHGSSEVEFHRNFLHKNKFKIRYILPNFTVLVSQLLATVTTVIIIKKIKKEL